MASRFNPGRKKRPSTMNYNATKRWLTNKVRKITRHLKKLPNDEQAKAALAKAQAAAS